MYDSYAFLPGLVGGNREHMESITTTTTTTTSPSSSSSAVVGVVADVEKGEKDPKKFSRLCCRPNKKTLALIMMVFFDFIATYWAILCFKFTSVTSGTIIQTATVPISCTLGFLFMNRRYSRRHVVGAFVSMAALLFLIVCDSLEVNEEGNNVPHPDKNPRLGDALAFFAAIGFSATNILQEYSIDSGVYQNEILAAFGFYGTLFAIVAIFAEHKWNFELLMNFFARIEHHDVMIYILTSVTLFASFASAYRALKYVDAGTFNVVLLQQSLLVGMVRFFGFEGGFSSTTQAVVFVGTFTVQAIGILVYATAGDVKHREETSGSESEKRSILFAAAKQ
jgi:drug/metabolite transporter (DMT)-like permease